jgi:tRNA G18 (ribose-2'-O)-methylase SpoU
MAVIMIDDPDDPRLAVFRQNDRGLSNRPARRDDDAPGRFIAEGDLVVERALDAGCRPLAALVDVDHVPAVAERITGAPVFAAGTELRQRVARMGRVQPIVAVFERPPRTSADDLVAATDRVVAIEAVDNPANVGSIVRNAAALGWGGVLLDETSADPFARRALRVAMGTAFTLPHARSSDLAGTIGALSADGWTTVALTLADDAIDLDDIVASARCAVVIGAERSGLSDGVAGACNVRARIPMNPGVDSLNAAAASAIACYRLRAR